MGLVITNNVAAINAQNNLARTSISLARSLERLSSGLKINRGADGPAALIISELQRAQIAGLGQAIENSERAVAMVQTAEGALNEINTLLVQARELALDSANTAVNDTDTFAANQAELDNILDTINRIANNTQFGTRQLLNGNSGFSGTVSDANVSFLTATSDSVEGTYAVNITDAADRGTVSNPTDQTGALAQDENLTINGVVVQLTTGMDQAQVIARINQFTGQTGVTAENNAGDTRLYTNQFGSNVSVSVQSDVAAASDSSGFGTGQLTGSGDDVDGDFAGNAAAGQGNVLTGNAGTASAGVSVSIAVDPANVLQTVSGGLGNVTVIDNSLVFQIGPNANQTASVALDNVRPVALGLNVVGNQFANLNLLDVQSTAGANDAIAIIDVAIREVSTMRGRVGAFQQNTLEATQANLRATLENTQAAESVIRDTDFASEVANFTKMQVMVQAGVSVLSSANQLPQLALLLLQSP